MVSVFLTISPKLALANVSETLIKFWVIILELSNVLAGPAVGMFFAELGATVFKIENNPLELFSYESINGHYNIEGHKKVGETIFRFTKD